MLEIIIMIGVIGWFARTAKSKGKSRVLWGFIGTISFYGPLLIFGHAIYPLFASAIFTNEIIYFIVGLILNLAIGIGFCFLARKILLSSKSLDTRQT